MENKPLVDSDLLLLLEKKLSLLEELLQLSNQQITTNEMLLWEPIFQKKDDCIENLQRIDGLIETWSRQRKRELHSKEILCLQRIKKILEQIQTAEQLFEEKVKTEQEHLSREKHKLGSKFQVMGYLGNQKRHQQRFRTS